MKKKRGVFITFEGTEGAGKSTLIRALEQGLQERGISYLLTREPGGTDLAERIRNLILQENMTPYAELFLYEAARAEHVQTRILPALEEGSFVLCDRFADSSLAYQGYARGLDWKTVKTLNRIATDGLEPDLTVFLDIDVETGLNRAQEGNRFEAEGVAFQKKVRQGFLKIRKEKPKRWLVIKVKDQNPEALAQTVFRALEKRKLLQRSAS